MLPVTDVMTRPVITVRCNEELRTAAVPLAEFGYAGVPVVDAEGRLAGMLTVGDVLRGREAALETAGAAMTTPAIAAEISSDLDSVGPLLLQRGVRSVPVVDDANRVVGIVSRGDVLRLNLTSDDAIAVGVQKLLDNYTGRRRWIAQVREGSVVLAGRFDDESERRIAQALARTVPAVREVRIGAGTDERNAR